jgi:hypothetical protein
VVACLSFSPCGRRACPREGGGVGAIGSGRTAGPTTGSATTDEGASPLTRPCFAGPPSPTRGEETRRTGTRRPSPARVWCLGGSNSRPDGRGGAGRRTLDSLIFESATGAPHWRFSTGPAARHGTRGPGRRNLCRSGPLRGPDAHRCVTPRHPARSASLHRRPGRSTRRAALVRLPGSGFAKPARRRRSRPTLTTPHERAPRWTRRAAYIKRGCHDAGCGPRGMHRALSQTSLARISCSNLRQGYRNGACHPLRAKRRPAYRLPGRRGGSDRPRARPGLISNIDLVWDDPVLADRALPRAGDKTTGETFADRGQHALKGLPEEMRLFARLGPATHL